MAARIVSAAVDDAAAAWRAPGDPASRRRTRASPRRSASPPRAAPRRRPCSGRSRRPPFGAGLAAAPRPRGPRPGPGARPHAPPPRPYAPPRPAAPPPPPWDLLAEVRAVAALPREPRPRGQRRRHREGAGGAPRDGDARGLLRARCLQKLSEAGKEFTRQSGVVFEAAGAAARPSHVTSPRRRAGERRHHAC